MAEKINIEGSFDGTVKFARFDFVGKNETPTIKVICTDSDTGRTAWGDMWCSEKALPYTIKALRSMGIEGKTDDDVIDAFADGSEFDCEFDVEQQDQYFNAKNVRGRGAVFEGESSGVAKDDWAAKVFGTKPAQSAPTPVDDDTESPF